MSQDFSPSLSSDPSGPGTSDGDGGAVFSVRVVQARRGTAVVSQVIDLARRTEVHDGDPPFSDQTLHVLRSAPQTVTAAIATVRRDDAGFDPAAGSAAGGVRDRIDPESGDARGAEQALLGAAVVVMGQQDGEAALLEAAVAPEARGQGLGARLVDTALEAAVPPTTRSTTEHPVEAWAHGDHPAARTLARDRGFSPVRELHRLLRPLAGVAEDLPVSLPEGLQLRPFAVGRDEEAWLEVNAAAFADHPEQGRMTLEDLRGREAEDWFDPNGFLIAHPVGNPDRIAGFHWTKIHPAAEDQPARGEVHVVGIAPDFQGMGLGKALTVAGLHYLADQGLSEVLLYVDGDNQPAVNLYRAIGFQPWHLDVMYRRD